MPMLNLKHLYYFYVYAQELSTTRAAKRLQITSPALSNQLKQLEEILGLPLTRRASGTVVITSHGEMVLSYADRMFSTYEDLMSKLAVTRNIRSKCFRIGVGQNIAARFAFDLLSLLNKSYLSQSENVSITFDASERLLSGLSDDQFDLILGAFNALPVHEDDWISHQFAFPVRLFAQQRLLTESGTAAGELALMRPDRIIELANAKKIALVIPMQPSRLRDETDQFLLASRVRPLRTIECGTSSGIVQLIEHGLAIGFVPTPCLLDFKSANALTVLGPPIGYWSHGISLFTQMSEERPSIKTSSLFEFFSPPQQFK